MKTILKNKFKLNDNIEFLEKTTKNWRYGKIVAINNGNKYKIYSGTDIFWAKEILNGNKVQLETV